MHFLIGLGIIAGLIAFAYGENAARTFVGVVLATGASLAVFVAYLVISGSI